MEETELVPITRDNLDQLKEIAAEHGMPRSKRWYERLLFSDFQRNEPEKCRGYLTRSPSDGVVGCLCLAPIEGWVSQNRKTFYRVANFACRKKYGVKALEMIAEVMGRAGGNLTFTNSLANETALRCWRFARFVEGPESGRIEYFINLGVLEKVLASRYFFHHPRRIRAVYLAAKSVDCMIRKVFSALSKSHCCILNDFSHPGFVKFWEKFLAGNDGVITSRDPKILCDLFNESLHVGTMTLIAEFSGLDIVGYVLLRKVSSPYKGYLYFRVADWCSIGNDEKRLARLMRAAIAYCYSHNGLSLNYIGGNQTAISVLSRFSPVSRDLGRQTFVYHVEDADINDELLRNSGWFFGPYDGDHCLGYGGFVDY